MEPGEEFTLIKLDHCMVVCACGRTITAGSDGKPQRRRVYRSGPAFDEQSLDTAQRLPQQERFLSSERLIESRLSQSFGRHMGRVERGRQRTSTCA